VPNIAKGSNARTEVVSVRFTAAEKAELEAVYGNAARGVYVIVKAALRETSKK
jgi:hypothetical protein